MSQEQINLQIAVPEIVGVLTCKKCKRAVRALIVAKLKEQRDKSIEQAADQLVGATD
jgi:hypothetical protein